MKNDVDLISEKSTDA